MTVRQATIRILFVFAAVLTVATVHARAAYFVGTCGSGKANFTTIQQAVSSVPAGSTINVCPGVYTEQVTIQQSLTLQGVSHGSEGPVVIAGPASLQPAALPFITTYAVVNVLDASGPVNINDISIDASSIIPIDLEHNAAVLCRSSSCSLNRVLLICPFDSRYDPGNPSIDDGMIVDDVAGVSPTLTVKNSVFRFLQTGTNIEPANILLYVLGNAGGISVDIENNTLEGAPGGPPGSILFADASGTFSGNFVSNLNVGFANVYGDAQPLIINGNVIISGTALWVNLIPGPVTVSNNTLIVSTGGVRVSGDSNITIKGNQITGGNLIQPAMAGISLDCEASTATISGNTFVATPIAIANLPAALSFPNPGTFLNVPTITSACP